MPASVEECTQLTCSSCGLLGGNCLKGADEEQIKPPLMDMLKAHADGRYSDAVFHSQKLLDIRKCYVQVQSHLKHCLSRIDLRRKQWCQWQHKRADAMSTGRARAAEWRCCNSERTMFSVGCHLHEYCFQAYAIASLSYTQLGEYDKALAMAAHAEELFPSAYTTSLRASVHTHVR